MQTHHADHPTLMRLVDEGYESFATRELALRRDSALPPFIHYALLRTEATKPGRAEAFLSALCSQLGASRQLPADVHLLGPIPAPMEKRAGHYRAQLLLQSYNRRALQQLLTELCPLLEQLPQARQVRWSLDVDPVDSF